MSDIFDKADSCLRRGAHDEAIRIYRNALSKKPREVDYWNNTGVILLNFVNINIVPNVAKDTRIFAILGNSSLVSPETRRLWYLLLDKSHCDGLKVCLDEAERCFRKAVEISPGNFNARVFLGQLYEDMGFYEKARAEYDKAIAINEQKSQFIKVALKNLRERQERDLDADLRPRSGASALPIHEFYGDKLQALLKEIDQNHNGNPSMPW